MARIARVVATNIPHHVTQRGNRRQKTFFQDEDYRQYLNLMAEWCKRHNVEVWAYCLMPNHVHLIAASRNQQRSKNKDYERYESTNAQGDLWGV
jgi:putative transposase